MKKSKFKFSATSIVVALFMLLLIVYCISLIVPFVWGLFSSVKGNIEFDLNLLGLPEGKIWEWKWSNYKLVFENFYVIHYKDGLEYKTTMVGLIINSVLYAFGGAFCSTFVSCLVGYLIQRFPCKFSKLLHTIVIVTMITPIVGNQTSMLQILMGLKIYDTMLGAYLLALNFTSLYTLVFIASFKGVAMDFSEAAYLDGAGPITVFFRICLPLVKSTFGTIFLLLFIARWNDYSTPLLYLPNQPTLAYGLLYFDRSPETLLNFPNIKIAGCMFLLIPILLIFLIFHNKIMEGVSMGGVKE